MFRIQEILIPILPPLPFLFPPQPCCLSVPLLPCIIVLPTIQIKCIQIANLSISIMKSIMEWVSKCPVHDEVEPSTSHLSTTYQLPTAALTYNFNKIHLKAFLATTNTFDTYIINPFQSHYWPLPLLCFPSFPLPLFPHNFYKFKDFQLNRIHYQLYGILYRLWKMHHDRIHYQLYGISYRLWKMHHD